MRSLAIRDTLVEYRKQPRSSHALTLLTRTLLNHHEDGRGYCTLLRHALLRHFFKRNMHGCSECGHEAQCTGRNTICFGSLHIERLHVLDDEFTGMDLSNELSWMAPLNRAANAMTGA